MVYIMARYIFITDLYSSLFDLFKRCIFFIIKYRLIIQKYFLIEEI